MARPTPIWLFDLDNTLHDASRGIFQAIDHAMTEAVVESLQVPRDQADVLRQLYWQRYGATVIGMVRHHGIRAADFLARSHRFDVAPLVHSENGLARQLARLPGRKILLTNAPLDYAVQVLKALRLHTQFEDVWAIDHMALQGRIRPKPSLALMCQIRARLGRPARDIILVEDTLRNLKSARRAGMHTVHIFHPQTPYSARHKGRGHYVDLRVNSIAQLAARWPDARIPGIADHACNVSFATAS